MEADEPGTKTRTTPSANCSGRDKPMISADLGEDDEQHRHADGRIDNAGSPNRGQHRRGGKRGSQDV